jgi:thymidylate synthase
MKDINEEYVSLLSDLHAHGSDQYNERTGHHVVALPSKHFTVDLDLISMPIPGWRRMYPKSALAEILWILQGTTDPAWINKYTSIWELWTEDDGTIPTAYGYRWRNAFGRDQLDLAMKALQKDRSSRQVNVFAWHPGVDGNGMPNQPKNIPCVLGFTVNIIDGKLNMSVYLRSSDVIVGLPYDYMCYAFLMYFMSISLDVEPGSLCLNLAHAHYYRVHDPIVDKILTNEPKHNKLGGVILGTSIHEACVYPDAIMELPLLQAYDHMYNPKPELVL